MTASHEHERAITPRDRAVAQFDEPRRSLVGRIQYFLHANNSVIPLIILVLSLALFWVLVDVIPQAMGWQDRARFITPFSLTLVLQQVAIVGIAGAAQTLVVLTAGIDLSVGAIMVLSSVVMGQFTFRYGLPAPLAILCGLACGALCGFLNGALVAYMKLPPFIVTLGTWQILLATNFLYSANETIRSQDIEARAPLLQVFKTSVNVGGAVLNAGVGLMLLLVALLWYVLNHTAWGRHVYALGDDREAAELAGVRTRRITVQVYIVAGVICALAGWVLIGRLGSVSPQSGQFTNIESVTAVVIGGISLFGGRGSVLGMLFGALIVGVFSLGLRLVGTDPQWTLLLIGVLIVGAVALDQWVRRISA